MSLDRHTSLLRLAVGFAVMGMIGCGEQPVSWIDQCVNDTRASREFCECLDERRVVREGKVILGGGRKLPTGAAVIPPVYREPSLEDEKACRSTIIERIDSENPLQ